MTETANTQNEAQPQGSRLPPVSGYLPNESKAAVSGDAVASQRRHGRDECSLTPYYEASGCTIYHGDCQVILPHLKGFDTLLTDPPYPDCYTDDYGYFDGILNPLLSLSCLQLIFWSVRAKFPLPYSAVHIWDKKIGCASQYERIFERNGGRECRVFGEMSPNNRVRAQIAGDVVTGHKSQKPTKLISKLLQHGKAMMVIDPWMGSGSTVVAAKNLGVKAIGIEIEERYCEIAAKRLEQEVLNFAPSVADTQPTLAACARGSRSETAQEDN